MCITVAVLQQAVCAQILPSHESTLGLRPRLSLVAELETTNAYELGPMRALFLSPGDLDADLFGVPIDRVGNEISRRLERFLALSKPQTKLSFGQYVTVADRKTSHSAATTVRVEGTLADHHEYDADLHALRFLLGAKNDAEYDPNWYRGNASWSTFAWRPNDVLRVGFGARGRGEYNTPTSIEYSYEMAAGPVIRVELPASLVTARLGYYWHVEELDDDLPARLGFARSELESSSSGAYFGFQYRQMISTVAWHSEWDVEVDFAGYLRASTWGTQIRVPVSAFVSGAEHRAGSTDDAHVALGVDWRHFDLGRRLEAALPFRDVLTATLNLRVPLGQISSDSEESAARRSY